MGKRAVLSLEPQFVKDEGAAPWPAGQSIVQGTIFCQ